MRILLPGVTNDASVVPVGDTKKVSPDKNDERKIWFLSVFISAHLCHFSPFYANLKFRI